MFGATVLPDTILAMGIEKGLACGSKKIKEAVENYKSENSHESFETMMYKAIVDSLKQVSAGRYNGKDCIYDAASIFMNDWSMAGHLGVSVCHNCLKVISEENSVEEFLNLLIAKISKTDVLKNHFVIDGITKIENTTRDNLDISMEILSEVKDIKESTFNFPVPDVKEDNTVGVKFTDHKKYYIDKWNGRLFLHTREKDRPLTLKDAFIFPGYYIDDDDKIEYDNLKELLNNFILGDERTMILFGYPGMGKTSITSYLANKYQNNENILIIRLKKTNNYTLSKLFDVICEELKCKKDDLEGKTLILDGFDELNSGHFRQGAIQKLLLDIKDIDNIKLIITSREGYIDVNELIINQVIHMRPFDESKIGRFYEFMADKEFPNIVIDNKEVLGIPVILYMALSVGIPIEEGGSKAELYERIFALSGGIFDRFESSTNRAYENGKHSIQEIKEELNIILQKVALQIWISKEESISKKHYLEIAGSVLKENEQIIFDFPIKNLYEEGNKIEFVHKSIYEYFVAEYMFQEIYKDELYKNPELLAGVLGRMLGERILSNEIEEFLKYKIQKYILTSYNMHYFSNAFDLMIENGMSYYSKIKHKDLIFYEAYILFNMLTVIHYEEYSKNNLYNCKLSKKLALYIKISDILIEGLNYINFRKGKSKNIYVHFSVILNLSFLDLSGVNLNDANLPEADLHGTKLSGAKLGHAKLSEASLSGADLSGADLRDADLSYADLTNANFTGTRLEATLFDITNIKVIEKNFPELIQDCRVLDNLNIVSYKEYKKLYPPC